MHLIILKNAKLLIITIRSVRRSWNIHNFLLNIICFLHILRYDKENNKNKAIDDFS